jgi:hypothetical protein
MNKLNRIIEKYPPELKWNKEPIRHGGQHDNIGIGYIVT